jgi:hypothetical protein
MVFEIYPNPTTFHVVKVGIFDSDMDFRNFYRQISRIEPTSQCCFVFPSSKAEPNLVGTICFHRKRFNHGTIAHETLHSTIQYLRMIYKEKPSLGNKDFSLEKRNLEEHICSIQQNLINQIYQQDNKTIEHIPDISLKYEYEDSAFSLFYNSNQRLKQDNENAEKYIKSKEKQIYFNYLI